MSEENKKYGVKPEVLKRLKFTERDIRLSQSKPPIMIQGVVATPPEEWTDSQLRKAKALQINEWTYEELRNFFDYESSIE